MSEKERLDFCQENVETLQLFNRCVLDGDEVGNLLDVVGHLSLLTSVELVKYVPDHSVGVLTNMTFQNPSNQFSWFSFKKIYKA